MSLPSQLGLLQLGPGMKLMGNQPRPRCYLFIFKWGRGLLQDRTGGPPLDVLVFFLPPQSITWHVQKSPTRTNPFFSFLSFLSTLLWSWSCSRGCRRRRPIGPLPKHEGRKEQWIGDTIIQQIAKAEPGEPPSNNATRQSGSPEEKKTGKEKRQTLL